MINILGVVNIKKKIGKQILPWVYDAQNGQKMCSKVSPESMEESGNSFDTPL